MNYIYMYNLVNDYIQTQHPVRVAYYLLDHPVVLAHLYLCSNISWKSNPPPESD